MAGQLVISILALFCLLHLKGGRLQLHQVPSGGTPDEVVREVLQDGEAVPQGRHILVGQSEGVDPCWIS